MTRDQEKLFLEMKEDVKNLSTGMKTMNQSMEPMLQVFDEQFIGKLVVLVAAADSVIVGKKLLAGLAVIVASIVSIGGGALWFIGHFKSH